MVLLDGLETGAADEWVLLKVAALAVVDAAAATDGGLLEAVFLEKKEKRFFCLLPASGTVLTMAKQLDRSINYRSADSNDDDVL
jgi:hypothetical protein